MIDFLASESPSLRGRGTRMRWTGICRCRTSTAFLVKKVTPMLKSLSSSFGTGSPPPSSPTRVSLRIHSSIPITISNPPDANDVAADGRSDFVTEAPPPVHLNVNRAEGGEPPVTMVVGRATGKVYFGHPMSDIVEGKRLYTRKCLCQSGAHRIHSSTIATASSGP